MLTSGFVQDNNTINNQFTDVSLLHASTNAYSETYKAKRNGRWHTLKRIIDSKKSENQYTILLQKEFSIAYQLVHSNIVQTIGFEDVPQLGYCIVQEYIDGVTWREFFLQKHSNKETLRLIKELCDALVYLGASGVIHGDITPDNILITNKDAHVKIIDFGLSDRSDYAILKKSAGTINYAAPEQLEQKNIDAKTDIYSFGVLISELPSIPYRWKKIAKRCMNKNSEKRYSAIDLQILFNRNIQRVFLFSISILLILLATSLFWLKSIELSEQKTEYEKQSLVVASQQVFIDSVYNRKQAIIKMTEESKILIAELYKPYYDSLKVKLIPQTFPNDENIFLKMKEKYLPNDADVEYKVNFSNIYTNIRYEIFSDYSQKRMNLYMAQVEKEQKQMEEKRKEIEAKREEAKQKYKLEEQKRLEKRKEQERLRNASK